MWGLGLGRRQEGAGKEWERVERGWPSGQSSPGRGWNMDPDVRLDPNPQPKSSLIWAAWICPIGLAGAYPRVKEYILLPRGDLLACI